MDVKEVLNDMGCYLPLKKSCKRPQEGHVKFNSIEEQHGFYQGHVQKHR